MKKGMRRIKIGDFAIGQGCPLVLIAGPCVIESERESLASAKDIKDIAGAFDIPFIFKSSFDKANRMSVNSYRGPGIRKGLAILKKIKQKVKVPVISDVHCSKDVSAAAGVLDIIQIPAFLCRQTDIVLAAARTGRAINIKKGQFMAPWDMLSIIRKVEAVNNKSIILTDRGVCFGYNNLVSDFRSLGIMREFGYPVVYDATHSVQLPGGKGSCSGGQSQFVSGLSRAAVAFGCDGLFLEVHVNPRKALCDGLNMIDMNELKNLLGQVKKIERALR